MALELRVSACAVERSVRYLESTHIHTQVVDGVAHVTKGPPELRGWHLYEDPIDGSGSDRGDLRVQCGGSDDDEEYVSGATGSMEDAGELTCVQLRDKLKGL